MSDDVCKPMRSATEREPQPLVRGQRPINGLDKAPASLEDPRERRFVERYVESSNGTCNRRLQQAFLLAAPERWHQAVEERTSRKQSSGAMPNSWPS